MTPSKLLLAWIPVVVAATIIWRLGGDGFDHSQTSRFLGPLLETLIPWLSDAERAELHDSVRKLAHPMEYGLLAVLWLRAICLTRPALPLPTTLLRASLLALLGVLALASADEIRQSFSATRTGSAWDVALDVVGAVVALSVVAAVERWRGVPLFGKSWTPRTGSGAA